MKKRLRKKLHLKEYAEYGIEFELSGTEKVTENEFDTAIERFVFDFIEGNGLYCAGSWNLKEKKASFIVEIGALKEASELYAVKIRQWLETEHLKLLGEFALSDLWYPERKVSD
jgi:uncharacterized protein